ncbi:MAG: branched-chain amino acid aminotransferase [Clostridia bacterium]|nr:branched-chain amino acid aminotransferase [Clostridia bacterium]
MELKIIEAKNKKQKPTGALGFGKIFTDHMFVMEYENGAWGNARIQPYAPFTLDPSVAVFHYAQAIFEGTKAYKNEKGEIRLFRPRDNFLRMNDSGDRICIPPIDVDFVLQALEKLVLLEKDWIPTENGTALYIRPSIIAVDPVLGVHASHKYIFFIILSPVGAYYAHGLEPVGLYVEKEYVRASKGGTGHHKVAGNYAASLKAGEKAIALGYDQVMWLDAKEHKYVEEVGSMNIFFVLNGKVVTPALVGSILPGITRKSVIQLFESKGIAVEERLVEIDEVMQGIESGACTEIFGTGTAAVISPVGRVGYGEREYTVCGGKMGEYSSMAYREITGIQTGKLPDPFGWVKKIGG